MTRQNTISDVSSAWQRSQLQRRVRVAGYRGLQLLGWPGLLGLVLCGLAVITAGLALQTRQALSAAQRAVQQPPSASTSPATAAVQTAMEQRKPLPSRQEVHALIGQIQDAAAARQLAWQSADYRFKAATADSLARLEVHGSLRGPYKPLRIWLGELKAQIPALVLQEASFSRPHPDVAEVDAKLVLVIPLADAIPPVVSTKAQR